MLECSRGYSPIRTSGDLSYKILSIGSVDQRQACLSYSAPRRKSGPGSLLLLLSASASFSRAVLVTQQKPDSPVRLLSSRKREPIGKTEGPGHSRSGEYVHFVSL